MALINAPEVTVPGTIYYNGQITIDGIVVTDPSASELTVNISVDNADYPASLQGTLELNGSNVVGNGTGQLTLTGTPTQIATELAEGVVYTPLAGSLVVPFSPDLVQAGLVVSVSDGNVTAYANSNLISEPWVSWTSSNPNYSQDAPGREADPPTITVPDNQVDAAGQPLTFGGFSVSDAYGWVTGVTISVGDGTLQLPAEDGLTIIGNGTSQLSVSGTTVTSYLYDGSTQTIDTISLAAINAALDGLTYTPNWDLSASICCISTLYPPISALRVQIQSEYRWICWA